jgi:rRNA pseudouridine-1189 N-methylase Emg1 (Nep1/Mra1 family)
MMIIVILLYVRRNKVLDIIEEIDRRRKIFISKRGDGKKPDDLDL